MNVRERKGAEIQSSKEKKESNTDNNRNEENGEGKELQEEKDNRVRDEDKEEIQKCNDHLREH